MVLKNISSVLLLGTENQLALPVIRMLGSVLPEDARIHSLSFKKGSQIPAFSRYVHSHYCLQSTNEDELVGELLKRIEETEATVILPVGETYVRMLSVLKHRLEKHICLPPLSETPLFDSLVHKNKLHKLLQKHHFIRANTYSLNGLNISLLEDDFFPCLIKPVRESSGRGIKKIKSRKALNMSISKLPPDNYILQEFIPGQDIDCSLLAVDGEIKAFTIQKGMENRGFRFSTAIKFENNKSVFNFAKRLIKITGYSGIAHLDFRLDERDGRPRLIDFNARFWRTLSGSKAAGVDFVFLTCLASTGVPFEQPHFHENIYFMGRSTLKHYYRKILNRYSGSAINTIQTDLWEKVNDPLPEIMRYTNRFLYPRIRRSEGLFSDTGSFRMAEDGV
ncbi:MAG TPA: ATP-grasp domain-containing protein [Balneolaceae bacterium]